MAFTRFNGERGGIIRLEAKFYKTINGTPTLTNPFSQNSMTIDILNSAGDTFISGLYFGSQTPIHLSGLTPVQSGVGHYYYDFQTISTMDVGSYRDRWNNIQFSEGDTPTNPLFSFTVRFNDEDLSDWDVIPG